MQIGGMNRDSGQYVELERMDIVCDTGELKALAKFFMCLCEEAEGSHEGDGRDKDAHFHLRDYWKGWIGADSDIAVILLAGKEA